MEILGSRLRPRLANLGHVLLRYLEATAALLGSKFGDLGASWAIILAGSWGQVRALCGHVEAKWGYAGLGARLAILWLRWCRLGANFGDFGAHVDAMWGHFRPGCFC